MKCENLLLDSSNNIKISDFGFSRFFDPGDMSRTFCGSAAYAAPEILQGITYHLPLHDIWSIGIILYIMVGFKLLVIQGAPELIRGGGGNRFLEITKQEQNVFTSNVEVYV